MIDLVQHLIKPGPAVKVAAQIERLVRDGRIEADALLPPVRDLAHALGVSPGTAAAAYKALRTQGVVATDGRRGTRVLPRPSAREYMETPAPAGTLDLMVANPDPRLLPDLRPIFAAIRTTSDSYGGAHVEPQLLERMGAAFRADGIDASHLVVTSGAIATIYRALRACLAPGDKVAVEDPGFNEHHGSARAHAMAPVPVAIDDEGMFPEALSLALRGGARAVILTPRLQSPTGAAFSRARAAALRDVLAQHPDVMVLVDDFSSLLSDVPYHDCLGKRRDRWLVVRSFNKAIAPDLRVGVAAADAETADRLAREQWLADGWVSIYLQRIAAAALASRKIGNLLRRARETYAQRRTSLIEALARRGIPAHGATGLNVWIPVPDEAATVRGMLGRGWCVRAGARYRLRSAPAIRITIAELRPDRAEQLADDLRAVLSTGISGRAP
ncbi:MAG TPA: aminotransferase class I/II-fold pyridoxal phosphate-dependent enzyme [Myxococcales bacterium]|nr:aminotransferase class I/II-fold pyridoxal phosphate-dependent enzyme [Myxococcales bacterium]